MVRFWIFDLFWAQVFEATAALQLQCRLRVVIATNILVCFHHFSFMWSACHAFFDKMFPTETLQIHLLQPACCKVSRAHSPQQIALNLITVILDGSSSCAPDSRKCWSETQSALWLQVFTERYSAPTIWSKCWRVPKVISMQAVLRASLLVTFRLAQRQRHAKVPLHSQLSTCRVVGYWPSRIHQNSTSSLELHIAQLRKTGTTMSFTCSKTEIATASAQQYQCRLDPQCTNHFVEQEFVKVLRIFVQ